MAEDPSDELTQVQEFLSGVDERFLEYAEALCDEGFADLSLLAACPADVGKVIGIKRVSDWIKIVNAAKEAIKQPEESGGPGGEPDATEPPADVPQSLESWSSADVAMWARVHLREQVEQGVLTSSEVTSRQISEYSQNFQSQNINGDLLAAVTRAKDLERLAPGNITVRFNLFTAIKELQDGPLPDLVEIRRKDNSFVVAAQPVDDAFSTPNMPTASVTAGSMNQRQQAVADTDFTERRYEAAAVDAQASTTRQRLLNFYKVYNPAKLEDTEAIDRLLHKYQGREQQLFEDLQAKYILNASAPTATGRRKQLDKSPTAQTDAVLEQLSSLYYENFREIEEAFRFPEFHTPLLDRVDFMAKPIVMLVGQYSVGKTSFIRFLVERDFPGIRIGPEPTTDSFFAIMHGSEERLIPGHTVPMDREKPFRTLERFGAGFLNKFHCAELPAPVLESVTFVDTPGILSGEKQRLGRNYDFAKVVEWFAYRADRILLLFDAHKLDISDEFKAALDMLKGHDDKIRCVLNKADSVDNQQLLRVYGALMWSLGKIVKTPEVLRVYVGSFWDEPYANEHNAELFDAESADLLADLRSLPRHCATRKINEFVKRARQLRVHCIIIEHLRSQFGMFGKAKKQAQLLNDLRNQFREIARQYELNLNDFPNPDKFRQLLAASGDISRFPKFKREWREKFSRVLESEIPQLMKHLPTHQTASGGDGEGYNPFAAENDMKDAELGGASAWVVTGTQKQTFDAKFHQLQLSGGKASGQQVRTIMQQSGLSNAVLRQIWTLADIDRDGKMDADEFALCMYFIEMVKQGIALPQSLTIRFVPPSKRSLLEWSQ